MLFYPARTHASRHTEPRLRAPECGLPLYFPLMMTRSPTGRLIPIPNLTMSQYCSRAIQSAHGTLKPGSQLTDKIRSGNLSQINIMGLVIVMPKPFRRKPDCLITQTLLLSGGEETTIYSPKGQKVVWSLYMWRQDRKSFAEVQRSGNLACFVIFQNPRLSDKHEPDTPPRKGEHHNGYMGRPS